MDIHDVDFSAVGTGREAITVPNQTPQHGDSLGVLAAKLLNAVTKAATPGTAVVNSTDGTPSKTYAAGEVSAVAAIPSTDVGQISVNINSAGAVTLPAGQGWQWASGHPACKNAVSIVITVTAGTATFVTSN